MVEKNQVQIETDKYFKKVDSEIGLDRNEDYASGKHSKGADFFIGVGIVYGVGFILSLILGGFLFFILRVFSMPIFSISLVYPLPVILEIAACILIYKKYFKGRRLVKTGMWVAVLIPLITGIIMLGMCAIALGGLY